MLTIICHFDVCKVRERGREGDTDIARQIIFLLSPTFAFIHSFFSHSFFMCLRHTIELDMILPNSISFNSPVYILTISISQCKYKHRFYTAFWKQIWGNYRYQNAVNNFYNVCCILQISTLGLLNWISGCLYFNEVEASLISDDKMENIRVL